VHWGKVFMLVAVLALAFAPALDAVKHGYDAAHPHHNLAADAPDHAAPHGHSHSDYAQHNAGDHDHTPPAILPAPHSEISAALRPVLAQMPALRAGASPLGLRRPPRLAVL
jgi:hypothetical protein